MASGRFEGKLHRGAATFAQTINCGGAFGASADGMVGSFAFTKVIGFGHLLGHHDAETTNGVRYGCK
jgi:hypothetical protein